MKKAIRILAVLAVAQILLAALALSKHHGLSGPPPGKPLLSFDRAQIDQISLQGPGKAQPVVLTRKDGQWRTADGFPADSHKIERLLEKLSSLKAGLPVSTSAAALTRFKLDEAGFERKIELSAAGKPVATLLLGNGAGARKTHARRADSNQVVAVALGAYDLPLKTSDWQDKTLLQLNKDDIAGLRIGDLAVSRDESAPADADGLIAWKTDTSLPPGKILNQKAINEAVNALTTLRFSEVLDDKAANAALDNPVLSLEVTRKQGKRRYQLGKHKDQWVLKVSDRKERFKLPGYAATSLKEKCQRSHWLMDAPKPAETSKPENAAADEAASKSRQAEPKSPGDESEPDKPGNQTGSPPSAKPPAARSTP